MTCIRVFFNSRNVSAASGFPESHLIFSTENTHVLLIVVSLSQTSSIKDGMVHARSPNRASEDISPGLDSKFISVPGNNGTHDVPGHFGKEAVQSTDITDPPVWLKNLILALQGGTNFRVLNPALLVAEADAEVEDPVAVFDELVPVPEAVLEPEVVVPVAPVALLAALDEVELADETHETTDGKLVTPEVLHRF
ncbi:hypothetical protein ACHAPG_000842 [Botrytis cinerea]